MWYIAYIFLFLSSFIAAFLLTKIFRRLAVRWEFIDHPSERKFHKKSTPLLGGAAIFLGFWIAMSIGLCTGIKLPLSGLIFIGSLAIAVVGLWDDKFALSVKRKLLFQIAVALFTVLIGIRAKLFLPPLFSYIVSFIWILVITNAFNLLDNMDGVSGGIAFISSLLLLIVSILMKNYFVSAMISAFMGALAGFLWFNFPPASVFMGDCGSMFIGYIVSVVTILGTYYKPGNPTLFPVVIPLLILAVPLFDVLSVIFIRIVHKKPIFHPDKNHFSHRLVNLGMSVRTAVLFLYLVTFCVGLPSILLPQISLVGVVIVFSQAVGIMIIIAVLEYYGKNGR